MEYLEPLERRGNNYYIDNYAIEKLVNKYSTPLYVYSKNRILDNYNWLLGNLSKAFKEKGLNVKLAYACKANPNDDILQYLYSEGSYFDCASIYEVKKALKLGFDKERLFYTGVSNKEKELNYLVSKNIKINLDSDNDLSKIKKMPNNIGFRINPDFEMGFHEKVKTGKKSQFGIPFDKALKAYDKAMSLGIKKLRMHAHSGSGSLNYKDFTDFAETMLSLVERFAEHGIFFYEIDFGGGFGVPYKPEEEALDIARLSEDLSEILSKRLKEAGYKKMPTIIYEPGRYIVADSSVLVTRVTTIKENNNINYAGVDTGFYSLIRPALYNAYHHIVVDGKTRAEKKYSIYGKMCESTDILAKDRLLPKLEENDILIIQTTGAYGYAMASNFMSFPLPKEVIIDSFPRLSKTKAYL